MISKFLREAIDRPDIVVQNDEPVGFVLLEEDVVEGFQE